ncbi:hypothetical protein [Mesorhizobium sp.]|uniref:hypothetical protein n=1 Tax=Mesorhizobium sp. TaxID=1871066 RepID=UPI000FE470BA|nr:hypothetical protein [Mesorhizobium sp.]RWG02585.1 MAG: hypothetical protein EOQ54_19730 [Mesorhizobium sp.]RWH00784.1 MAG: hypothetical protein EOQ72_09290 [Mesorhizobium sp.]TIN47603.1 MAG: hypothetical protein E5Y25_05285 [Mesorhizobium sp.]TIR92658.1 MAG: hypothetical protein E5X08_13420 [Mesorhizobium sp.]
MDIPTEVWIGAAYGGIIFLVAIGRYLSRPKEVAKVDPVITGVGIELGSREQTERLISEVKRIGDILTDKNTEGINDRLDALAATVERLLAERSHTRRRG